MEMFIKREMTTFRKREMAMFINTTCYFTLVYKEKAWACLWKQLASLRLSSSSSHGNTKPRPTYQQVFLFVFFCHMSCFYLRPYYTLLFSYVTLGPPAEERRYHKQASQEDTIRKQDKKIQ